MHLELIAMFVPVLLVVIVMKYYFGRTITWLEVAIQTVAALAIVGGTYYAGIKSRMQDTQFLNGVVTSKERETVACEHSYQCHCRTDSDGHESCDTCYEHPYDYDWDVYTNAGTGDDAEFTIDRIDRQGRDEPPRWTEVKVGEPVALERTFDNYILGAPQSIFHAVSAGKSLPAYPKGFDYSHVNRVITDGVNVPDLNAWNDDLTRMLSVLGPKKQVNVIIVLTKKPSSAYGDELRNGWLGGKKNDVVVVLGTTHYPDIAWADVFSWSKHDMLNVALRNDLTELKRADRATVIPTIQRDVSQYFERRPMAEYAYLRAEIEPTPVFRIIGWLLAVLAPLGIGIYFHFREDGEIGISSFSSRSSLGSGYGFRSRVGRRF